MKEERLGKAIITHARLMSEQEIQQMETEKQQKKDESKERLALLLDRQGKKTATLDDVLDVLLLIAKKVGV